MKSQTLPKLTLPNYKITLPVSGEKINFRPFIVREEKILLMALESQDSESTIDALKTIISECTYGKVNANELSIPDLCFIFINIRAKSVGEHTTPSITCKHCKENNDVDIDLTKIGVVKNKDHKNKIILEEGKGVVMKYPTLGMNDITSSNSNSFSIIADCIDYIYDGDNVYKSKEYKKEELINFIEELNHNQFEDVLKFFSTLPELKHEIKFECLKCKKENKFILEGIRDFFL